MEYLLYCRSTSRRATSPCWWWARAALRAASCGRSTYCSPTPSAAATDCSRRKCWTRPSSSSWPRWLPSRELFHFSLCFCLFFTLQKMPLSSLIILQLRVNHSIGFFKDLTLISSHLSHFQGQKSIFYLKNKIQIFHLC